MRQQSLVLLAAAAGVRAAVPADAVASLPGFGAPLSATYSGYLTISSSAGTKHMHYLFYTAQGTPTATTPLTLWLNGGPGCSSLEGAFQEGGPLWTAPGGDTLALNNYSVNKFAHTLYLEAPACVGFSYADSANGCSHDDNSQAVDNLAALIQFYALYPEFATNPFWITGESYAGIYIPTLAHAIWVSNTAGNSKIPLAGILVGNGCIGNAAGVCGNSPYGDYLSLAQFAGHGFISTKAMDAAVAACGNFSTRPSAACERAISAAGGEVGGNLDVYDIYSGAWGICNYGGLVSPPRRFSAPRAPRRPVRAGSFMSKLLSAVPNGCTTDQDLKTYLNTPAVQTALHVKATAWDECSNIDYSSTIADERTTIYPDLINKAMIKVVIFNGEADACVPITDNEWWTSSMGYPVKTPWSQWTASDGTPGGYVTEYAPPSGGSFTFITVRAAGHMVAQTQPIYGSDLFYRAVNGLPWGN